MSEKPRQMVLSGDFVAQMKQLHEEHDAILATMQSQQGIIRSERMEKQHWKNIAEEKSQTIRRDWEKLKKRLEQTEEKVLALVVKYPGMTHPELVRLFLKTYGFQPVIDNKLRALRKKGLVYSFPDTSKDNLLVWFATKEAVSS